MINSPTAWLSRKTRALQQAVDERGLAVVDVGDDGHVADLENVMKHRTQRLRRKVVKSNDFGANYELVLLLLPILVVPDPAVASPLPVARDEEDRFTRSFSQVPPRQL